MSWHFSFTSLTVFTFSCFHFHSHPTDLSHHCSHVKTPMTLTPLLSKPSQFPNPFLTSKSLLYYSPNISFKALPLLLEHGLAEFKQARSLKCVARVSSCRQEHPDRKICRPAALYHLQDGTVLRAELSCVFSYLQATAILWTFWNQ